MNLSISNLLHHYNKKLKDDPFPGFPIPNPNQPFPGPDPNQPPDMTDDQKKILGMTLSVFLVVLVIFLIL